MIKSMTGFGFGEAEEDGARASVEVRCWNHRFCDVGVHLPKVLARLEPEVVELVRGRISRGRVQVSVTWEEESAGTPTVDLELARAYKEKLEELKGILKLKGEIEIGLIAGLPEVVRCEREEVDLERAWRLISEACSKALEEAEAMREKEGRKLGEFLSEKLGTLEELVGEVEGLAPLQVERIRARLQERMREMEVKVDPDRIAVEAALLAQRSDVTEECVRLRSHISQFRDSLKQGGVVGRRLDFLLQEMYREANTIGAKAADARISNLAVSLKEGVEQLREQVQNVE